MNRFKKKPRICISLDKHWIYRLGADWFTYRRLIRRAGGIPFTVNHQNESLRSGLEQSIDAEGVRFDGLLLGGGIDVNPASYQSTSGRAGASPDRDIFELQLIRRALDNGVPIFGICRGCQLLNVAFGGALRTLPSVGVHRAVRRLLRHPVAIKRKSLLYRVLGTRRLAAVRSVHRQAVARPGNSVRVVARAADGVVEAIECNPEGRASSWCVGVQWHPELAAWGSPDRALLLAFVHACGELTTAEA